MDANFESPAGSKNLVAEQLVGNGQDLSWLMFKRVVMLGSSVAVVGAILMLPPLLLNEESMWVLRLMLSAGVVGVAYLLVARHRRHWIFPAEEMTRLIHEIRLGRAPIEEFSDFFPGNLSVVAAEVKLLLQELRHKRQAINNLNDEVRQRIANQSTAMERTISALRNQAVRDTLTGLFNRRMLDQMLPQVISACATDRKPMALLMIDLDYFKELNDGLGHAAGDELLRSVGQIIHSTIRERDIGFRYGGDEFAVLLTNCEMAPAKRVADRLESLVQSLGETYKLAHRPRLSVGICTLEELAEPSAANFLKRADERLYEVKAARRSVV